MAQLSKVPRILLVDDHPTFRHWVRKLLEREQFTVVGEASDGQQALILVEKLRPDLVLLDLIMPVLDGFETAGRIPGISPQTKIIALTVHSDVAYVLAAVSVGCAGFVAKSKAADQLAGAIRTVSRGHTHLPENLLDEALRDASPPGVPKPGSWGDPQDPN
jgi:DNA-binding NarL/FixJ family response regulator